jgi:hypothetical protein
MKVQNLYDKVKAGELTKEQFLMEIHRDTRFSSIIVTKNNYDDVISILKNKSIISDNPYQSDSPIKSFDIIGSIKAIRESANQPLNESAQKLKGGKGDKLTPDDVNYYEFQKGWRHELEHTDDIDKAKEIALDHLAEDPIYYTRLDMIEIQAKKKNRTDLPTEVKRGELAKDPHNQMEKVKKISTSRSGEQKEEKIEDYKKNVGNKKEKAKKIKVKTMKGGSGQMVAKSLKESTDNKNNISEAFEKTTTFKGPGKYRISYVDGGNFSSDIINIADEEEFKDKTKNSSKIEVDIVTSAAKPTETKPSEPEISIASKQKEVDPDSLEQIQARKELLKTSRLENTLKDIIVKELQLGDQGKEIYKNFINKFVKTKNNKQIENLIANNDKLKKALNKDFKIFNKSFSKKQTQKQTEEPLEKGEFKYEPSEKNYDVTLVNKDGRTVTRNIEISSKDKFDNLSNTANILSIVPYTEPEQVTSSEPKTKPLTRVKILIPDKNAGQKVGDVFSFNDKQIEKHINKFGKDSIEIVSSGSGSAQQSASGRNLVSRDPGTKSVMNPVTGRFETLPVNLGIKSVPTKKIDMNTYGEFQLVDRSTSKPIVGLNQNQAQEISNKLKEYDLINKYRTQSSFSVKDDLAKKIEQSEYRQLIDTQKRYFEMYLKTLSSKKSIKENAQFEKLKNVVSEIFKKKLNEYLYNILPTGPNVKQEELRRLLHNYQWTSPENDYQKINKQQLLQKIQTLVNDLGDIGKDIVSQETPEWGDQGDQVVNEDHFTNDADKISYILSIPGYKGTREELEKLDSATLDKAYKNAEKLMAQRKSAGLDKTDDKALRDQKFKEIGFRFR